MYTVNKAFRTEYGARREGNSVFFTVSSRVNNNIFLCLFDIAGNQILKEEITEYKLSGNVYSVEIKDIEEKEILYYYLVDGKIVSDRYKKASIKYRQFGEAKDKVKSAMSLLTEDDNCLLEDKRPNIKQSDVVSYLIHVRGFTKHSSSRVKGKGCYLGIIEKIPYFTELGINQIILMPAYDFDEFDEKELSTIDSMTYASKVGLANEGLERSAKDKSQKLHALSETKVNYWGYKPANYFCPKYEFSYSDNAVREFKMMVKALHDANIEVIMQMYFDKGENQSLIFDCIRYWYTNYNIDGFQLMGENLPVNLILKDELLYNAKLFINNIHNTGADISEDCFNRNIFDINDGFMVSMRKYLKSDGDSLHSFVFYNRLNPSFCRNINYLTKYEGFTLNDLVSYEHKHNELNGENNTDGSNYNFSWNCGVEGKSSKKAIKELRVRQIKNALCTLLLSQGSPMMFMGDEFMNTQNGNNNPYCQDNEISWLNWKMNNSAKEIFDFTKFLIAYRKDHKVLHQDMELKNMDYLQCGYPDISYHQDMAWKSDLNNYMLHIGIMLNGKYIKDANSETDDTLYLAYNMHWENHIFGLPRLKNLKSWEVVFSTCNEDEEKEIIKDLSNKQDEICIYKRSVVVFKATSQTTKEEK